MEQTFLEERIIVLKDLLTRIISKFRWLIIGGAVLAVALPLYRLIMQRKQFMIAEQEYALGLSGNTPPVMPHFSVKLLIIGAIIGILLAACVIAALYVLNGKLKTDAELAHAVPGCPVLGRLRLTELSKNESFAEKMVYGENRPSAGEEEKLLEARLLTTCRNRDISRVMLSGDLSPEQLSTLAPVQESLARNGIELERIGDIRRDPQAICKLDKGSGIVLVQTEAVSTYDQIWEELHICSQQQLMAR